jgi:hypothetical protein
MNWHGDATGRVWQMPDPRYLCVCVEQINYTPISFDDAMKML